MPLPNRLATYATALGALALGLIPLVGNLDWESTAGILGAVVAITGVVSVWLLNWGKWERGEGDLVMPGDETLEDDFDEAAAEPIPASHTATTAPAGTTYEPGETQRDNPPGFTSPPPKP